MRVHHSEIRQVVTEDDLILCNKMKDFSVYDCSLSGKKKMLHISPPEDAMEIDYYEALPLLFPKALVTLINHEI